MKLRGVLWDVGNVIVRWDPRRLYSQIFPDPAEREAFLGHVCTLAWHHAHDLGVPFADNSAALIAAHPHHEAAIRAWDARFIEMVGPPIPETEAVMDALAAHGVPQFALTNMPQSKWPQVRALSPAFRHLRGTVVSGDVGLTKPDPRIFAIACQRAGMAAQELLFVDDVLVNVEAAAMLGFQTCHYATQGSLRSAMEGAGLLEARP